jgi:preprotein translocase subunit SecG
MIYYVIVTLYVIVCALLILTILLQQGKGGDIANAFGGGGGSQAVFGARSGATLLTRATAVLAALFVIGAITLTVFGQRGPGSVVGGIDGPAPAAPAAATPAPAPAAQPVTPPPGNTTP